jgi:hypothetical protein
MLSSAGRLPPMVDGCGCLWGALRAFYRLGVSIGTSSDRDVISDKRSRASVFRSNHNTRYRDYGTTLSRTRLPDKRWQVPMRKAMSISNMYGVVCVQPVSLQVRMPLRAAEIRISGLPRQMRL